MADWTNQQQRAIYDRHHNLLVAAAAGAGKTAVLVERIIQLILRDRVSIDRMLVVTFTQAAAAEMRDRISSALLQNLTDGEVDQEYVRTQINLLSRATISTLHSFCLEVVRRYFHLINIDPKFRVGDSTETGLMKMEALERVMEQEYIKNDPLFLQLVEMYGGGKDDEPLQNMILRIYEFTQSQPEPSAWLQKRAADFDLTEADFATSPWVENIKSYLGIELGGVMGLIDEARLLAGLPGGPHAYLAALEQDRLLVDELLDWLDVGIDEIFKRLPVQHVKLARADKGSDPALVERVKKLRGQAKDALKSIQKKIFFQSPREFYQDIKLMQPVVECLGRLVQTFAGEYRSIKDGKGVLDFNDLEHFALAILRHSQPAAEYRRIFEFVFVDEYQDSNLVQETLVQLIAREDNVFMVGDVKQSIYGFRLADPELFIGKYETFKTDLQAVDQRIDLNANFRSRPEIIAGINDIFEHIMSKQSCHICYDDQARLYAGLEMPPGEPEPSADPPLELWLVNKKPAGEAGSEEDSEDPNRCEEEFGVAAEDEAAAEAQEDLEPLGDTEAEAQLAARRINQLVGTIFYDTKACKYRPLEYRDMVVLMRTVRQQTDVYLEAFTAAGIPVYTDVDSGYFATLEISIMVNLLRLIDNKRQDLPLLSVLRSPICRFSLEDLVQIRVSSQAPSFFAATEEYRLNHRDELQVRLQGFMDWLAKWQEAARYTPMDELIWDILRETGYYYYVGAMPGGSQRQANLRMLLDRARQYQDSSFKGLFHFLRFVDRITTNRADLGMAKTLGEKENVVRIMSIHKSKGLEFPVVIIAGLGRRFNLRDTMDQVLLHKELGLGPCWVDPEMRISRDSWARIAIKNRLRSENLAEEMRIFYVACTRPRERLIMIGSVNDLPAAVERWDREINPYQLSCGRSILDWVGPVVLRHRDGKPLRDLSNWPLNPCVSPPADYSWQISICDHSHVRTIPSVAQERLAVKVLDYEQCWGSSTEQEMIWKRFSWHYPYPGAGQIPSKITVSQVKDLQTWGLSSLELSAVPITRQPRLISPGGDTKLSGADLGTVFHLVMKHLDFTRLGSEAEIAVQLAEMVERELLRPEEAQSVNVLPIKNFFDSPLGQRISSSPEVCREVPFNLRYPAEEIFGSQGYPGEELLLQGVIDLYFADGDDLVLVDYKTDRITSANRLQLIETYRVQIELYKTALETILGQKVKAGILYFFDSEEAVTVT